MNLNLNTTSLFFLHHRPKQILVSFTVLSCSNKLSMDSPKFHFQIPRRSSGQPSRRPVKPFTVSNAAASSPSPSISGSSDQYLDVGVSRKEQEELQDPMNLADPDSCFCEFQGVHIHHKVYDPQTLSDDVSITNIEDTQMTPKLKLPMILLHGFGASVFSWNKVMKPLARLIGSKVLAFDRPAFGLTSRLLHPFRGAIDDSKPFNPYSMAYSVLTTLYFIDFLAAEKAILVGHSAGCIVALDSYFEAPERIAALILVAPAIFAPRPANTTRQEEDSTNAASLFGRFVQTLVHFSKGVLRVISRVISGMANMLSSLYKKALVAFLRSTLGVMLVRMAINKFGVTAVRNAWYDSKQVTDHIVQGYTKPLKAKGWDKALVEFTVAMLTDNIEKPPLLKRLQEIKCPVLIVTGDTDRIVPGWNAERLSKAIPGSVFEVIKNCGHLPQEEKPDQFIYLITKFLENAFRLGNSHQHEHVSFVA